jgi:hypothetical protein
MLKARYDKLMYDWEYKLTTRDTNRIVRPFEWGTEWLQALEGVDLPPMPEHKGEDDPALLPYVTELNRRIVEDSDRFYGYTRPTDFRLERHPIRVYGTGSHADPVKDDAKYKGKFGTFLRFTSAVCSPYPANNTVNARWFPAKEGKGPRRAIIVMPQWNSDAISHCAFGRLFNLQGISMLRLTMPYHDTRMPAELKRADYAVSANIGRTLASVRQAVLDIRCCADWLEEQGYEQVGALGTSLGSEYAFLASAHDPRISVNVFNHASTYFGDVVWTGHSTRHIRAAVEKVLDQKQLRDAWLGISPMAFFEKFERWAKRSLMIYTRYDQTFLPEFSRQIAAEFERRSTDATVVCLPCGHYTLGETPYKYMDAFNILRFTASAFDRA